MEKNNNIFLRLGFFRPIAFSKKGLLLYKKNKLYFYESGIIRFFKRIKIGGLRGFLSFSRFTTRIMHRYVYCGISSSVTDYIYFAANNGVYSINTKNELKKIFSFRHLDMHRPLSFFEIKDVNGFSDCIVFGDYSYNKERHSMSIYSIVEDKVNPVYTFPSKTIRHIHSIIPDKFNNRVLVFTGDKDEECAIWESKDNFSTINPVFKGKQAYRFCVGRAYSDGVVMVTDSPFDENNVYKLTSDNKIVKLFKIQGPAVFFSYYNDKLVFATDVENDEKSLSFFEEFFINKKGDGVLDDFSHVYIYDNVSTKLKEICRFKKDCLPMRIFGFGTVHFPPVQEGNKLFMFPMSVKKHDQSLLCLEDNL